MPQDLIINHDSSTAFIQSVGVAISTTKEKKPQPSTPIIKELGGSANIAFWGGDSNNLFPYEVLTDVKKTIELSEGIDFYWKSLVGSGIVYGYEKIDPTTGEETLIRVIDPAVEIFLKQNNIVDYYSTLAYNYKALYNCWIEMVMAKDRSQIIGIKCHKSQHCRYQIQDPKSGRINNLFINANWDKYDNEMSQRTISIPLIDKTYMPVESLRMRSDGNRYIYPVAGPGSENYYQLAPWNAVRESSWLDVVSSIPIFKKAIMDNQMLIRYHVQIPEYYWKWKYENWDAVDMKQRNDWKNDTFTAIKDTLTGAANAGKNLFTVFKYDQHAAKEFPGVKIEQIENQTFSGEYLADSAEGSQKIYHALGIDSTLLGTLPGKGQSAGSGSDKSVAWNIHLAKTTPDQNIQHQPLNFVFEYNGFNKKYEQFGGLKVWYKNQYLARLSEVHPADRGKDA